MIELDTIGERAIMAPPAAPTSPESLAHGLDARRRRRRMRWSALAIFVLIGLGGGIARLISLSDEQGSIAVTSTGPVESELGYPMNRGEQVWPDKPLLLDELLTAFATDVLRWPVDSFTVPDVDLSAPPTGMITGFSHPDFSDRSVTVLVRPSGTGWVIADGTEHIEARLVDGRLTGLIMMAERLVSNADTTNIDVYQSTGSADRVTRLTEPAASMPNIDIGPPIEPDDAGSFLIVARDADGVATWAGAVPFGFPDRLTVMADELFASAEPTTSTDFDIRGYGFGRRFAEFLIDEDTVRVIRGINDELEFHVATYNRGAGICTNMRVGESGGGGCISALYFNGAGTGGSMSRSGRKVSWKVLPDGVTIGDLGRFADVEVDASGRLLTDPFSEGLNRVVIVDGVAQILE